MVSKEISSYMAAIGRIGGRKSRRKLGADQARTMVRIREAGKAYREFHSRCFWSSPKGMQIKENDIPWVIDQLQKHGGLEGWKRAQKLCR